MSVTKKFTYTGAMVSYVVPDNNDGNGLTIDIAGARSGHAFAGKGVRGSGGRVQGKLAANPGDTLYLRVAGTGGDADTGAAGGSGGWPNGGAGGDGGPNGDGGGGGGGASSIRLNADTLAALVAAAAGGGGPGTGNALQTNNAGGDGGANVGAAGENGGGGGTQSAGGAGGASHGSATGNGSAGAVNAGGKGETATTSFYSGGGGGGGGYYGGGGGGSADTTHAGGGGGGGSNYTDPAHVTKVTSTRGYQAGNGYITFTYTVKPNQPVLNTPDDGSSLDPSTAQQFSWTFNSEDAADSQSKFDLRYSSDGGVTWTTVTKTTPNQYYLMPGGTLADGSYQWQVRTYSALGAQGPWSPSLFFTAAETPGAATITYPTSGGTVGSSDQVDWSVPNQDGYQVQVLQAGTVVFDTGEVDNPDARSQALSFATSGLQYKIQVRTILAGLWSPWQAITVTASFIPPPAPTVLFGTADPDPASGIITALQAVWTTPDPDTPSGQPAAQWVDLWLSTDGGATSQLYATELDIDGSWTFRTPASGIDYSVQAVAHANQTAAAASPWVR